MELTGYVRFALALIFVFGLIGMFAWAGRRFGMMPKARRGAARRLDIVEITGIDAKRRLVLVRRDDVEHLVMLGATTEFVIESGIPARDGAGVTTVLESTMPGRGAE